MGKKPTSSVPRAVVLMGSRTKSFSVFSEGFRRFIRAEITGEWFEKVKDFPGLYWKEKLWMFAWLLSERRIWNTVPTFKTAVFFFEEACSKHYIFVLRGSGTIRSPNAYFNKIYMISVLFVLIIVHSFKWFISKLCCMLVFKDCLLLHLKWLKLI